MKHWKVGSLVLAASVGLGARTWGQVPAVPAAPAAVAAPPKTLWSFLGMSKPQLKACQEKFCRSSLGQLLNNVLKPVGALTGGIVHLCPLTPTATDLAKPGAAGAAAKIKKDEAEAKERRAAIRYLGTVECHWWPEAEVALIAGLRADKNECVRLEAAIALSRGCCCTKRVIEALVITVTGSDKDGNPSETSDRVKAAAEGALQHCLACYHEIIPVDPKKGETSGKASAKADHQPMPALLDGSIQLTSYYQHVQDQSLDQVVARARHAVAEGRTSQVSQPTRPSQPFATGKRDVFHIMKNAMYPASTAAQKAEDTEEPIAGRRLREPVAPTAVDESNPGTPAQPATSARPAAENTSSKAVAPASPTTAQLLTMLRESAYPHSREWAAEHLAGADWKANPEVAAALLTAAHDDQFASVRLASIQALVKMKANAPSMVAALQVLRSDPDARIRAEVERALTRLVATSSVTAATPRTGHNPSEPELRIP